MKDYIEILICKWLIARLKWWYNKCDHYFKGCVSCQAWDTIKFLEEHIKLLQE